MNAVNIFCHDFLVLGSYSESQLFNSYSQPGGSRSLSLRLVLLLQPWQVFSISSSYFGDFWSIGHIGKYRFHGKIYQWTPLSSRCLHLYQGRLGWFSWLSLGCSLAIFRYNVNKDAQEISDSIQIYIDFHSCPKFQVKPHLLPCSFHLVLML